jgi:hypothetical protein
VSAVAPLILAKARQAAHISLRPRRRGDRLCSTDAGKVLRSLRVRGARLLKVNMMTAPLKGSRDRSTWPQDAMPCSAQRA